MLSYTDPAVSIPEADSYAGLRGWAEWSGDGKATALRRGQDYIAGLYNDRWAGDWANDTAPEPVKHAIIEAARRELENPGSLAPDITKAAQVSRKRVKAGPVETEKQFTEMKFASDGLPVIVMIDRLLAGLFKPSSGAGVDLLRV